MGFQQIVYSDFSGGYNDTSAAISIEDSQLSLSENADYAAEVKALQTRKGCVKINQSSLNGNVTDGYSWLIGSVFKKCLVVNGKLYDIDVNTGNATYKCDLSPGATHIYPYVLYNTLYFGDGQELYSWGTFDFATESGTKSITIDTIVKCNKEELGVKGGFYRSLKQRGAVDLSKENFKDTSNWEECTDVLNFSSSYVRKMTPYDPSEAEVVVISVVNSATSNATCTLCLDNVTKTFDVTSSMSVDKIVDELVALKFDGWEVAKVSNTAVFTSIEKKARDPGYVDPSTSGITFTYETKTDGKDNDCDLTAIKKCTIFCVHQGSHRVFAAGNPEDNGLYYSEIGIGTYFKSEINKIYPAVNGYGAVTAMINLSDSLLVSYESGWYSWRGTTPLVDASWKALNIPYGCISARTLHLTPNSFTFLARDGIYCVSVAILSDDYILLESDNVIKKLSENIVEKTINKFVNKKLCEGIFYENVYMLSFSTNGEYCDRVLKFEWNTQSFTLVTGWRVNRWLSDPEDLYFATENYLLKAFYGYTDVDTKTGGDQPINLHVKTKEYHLGTPMSNKAAQMIGFIFQQDDKIESNIDIKIKAGYQTYRLKTQDLAESLYYGRAWGKVWGYREAIVKVAEIVMISNTFQIEFENDSVDNPITLIGVGFIYSPTDVISPTILKDEVLLK